MSEAIVSRPTWRRQALPEGGRHSRGRKWSTVETPRFTPAHAPGLPMSWLKGVPRQNWLWGPQGSDSRAKDAVLPQRFPVHKGHCVTLHTRTRACVHAWVSAHRNTCRHVQEPSAHTTHVHIETYVDAGTGTRTSPQEQRAYVTVCSPACIDSAPRLPTTVPGDSVPLSFPRP